MDNFKNLLFAIATAASMTSCVDFADQKIAKIETQETLQEELIINQENMDAVVQKMQTLSTNSLYTKGGKREQCANLSYDIDDQTYMLSQEGSHYIIVQLDDGTWRIQQQYSTTVDKDDNIIEENKRFTPTKVEYDYVSSTLHQLVLDGFKND